MDTPAHMLPFRMCGRTGQEARSRILSRNAESQGSVTVTERWASNACLFGPILFAGPRWLIEARRTVIKLMIATYGDAASVVVLDNWLLCKRI